MGTKKQRFDYLTLFQIFMNIYMFLFLIQKILGINRGDVILIIHQFSREHRVCFQKMVT